MWTPFIVVIVVFGIILLAVIITLAVICTLGRKKSFKTDPEQQTYPADQAPEAGLPCYNQQPENVGQQPLYAPPAQPYGQCNNQNQAPMGWTPPPATSYDVSSRS